MALDLSGAYILDNTTGMGMSQDHQMMAQAIAERYPNVRLAQVPMHFRTAAEEFPFALIDYRTKEPLKELREREVTISFIFQWLYEHDTQARGVKEVYEKMLREKDRRKAEKADKHRQNLEQKLEIVQAVASSNLHTYKLPSGVKIGA
jgi:hypothetical protein